MNNLGPQEDTPGENGTSKSKCIVVTNDREKVIVFDDADIFIRKLFSQEPHKAYELLFRKYYGIMCNHAVRFVYSKQNAEDIVAEIFVSLWHGSLYNNIKTSYRAYLFTSVRNKCLTYIKQELIKESGTEVFDLNSKSPLPTPDQILEASDTHIKIERTVKGLHDRTQKIFVMSHFEGKKNFEIANELDISIKTVESHISKAMTIFREIFKK